MVSCLAQFHADIRGLKEIVLDSRAMAAAARVDLTKIKRPESQDFMAHPASIDTFCQIAGFIMNANENSDPEKEAFVNHGWDTLHLYSTIYPNRIYDSFVQMTWKEDTIWQGSILILDENEVVGEIKNISVSYPLSRYIKSLIECLKLQGVPRRLLSHVLSAANQDLAQARLAKSSAEPHPAVSLEAQGSKANSEIQDISQPSETIVRSKQRPIRGTLDEKSRKLVQIISEESQVHQSELSDETALIRLGIDSILSLIITKRVQEELAFDIGPSSTIFEVFNTIGEMKAELARSHAADIPDPPSTSRNLPTSNDSKHESSSQLISINSAENTRDLVVEGYPLEANVPSNIPSSSEATSSFQRRVARPCRSVVLQSPCSELPVRHKVFLFPDGSGSPYSYTRIHSHPSHPPKPHRHRSNLSLSQRCFSYGYLLIRFIDGQLYPRDKACLPPRTVLPWRVVFRWGTCLRSSPPLGLCGGNRDASSADRLSCARMAGPG